jgi:hypothetical protein
MPAGNYFCSHCSSTYRENLCTEPGIFSGFFHFMYIIQHCFMCCPSDSIVSEDAGTEPRTFATLALTAKRSNHLARFHSQTRLDLVHKLGWISSTTRLDLFYNSAIDLIHTRLYLIHMSARSHPQLGQISSTSRQFSFRTRIDLIHKSARSHQHSARSHPHVG